LWDFIKNNYKVDEKKYSFEKRKHSRSFSCNAVIQNDLLKKTCTQENLTDIQITYKQNNDSVAVQNGGISDTHDLVSENTNELVKNAQTLLQSVNATLKRSNSIAIRLNESDCPLNKQNINKEIYGSEPFSLYVEENIDKNKSNGPDYISVSDSYKELKSNKCEQIYVENKNESKNNIKTLEEENFKLTNLSLVDLHITEKSRNEESFQVFENQSQLQRIDNCFLVAEIQMWVIPESVAKIWAAEILLTLEALHQQDVVILDLRPDNILIDDCGHVSMTYIVPRKDTELLRLKKPYSSPELCMFTPPITISTSADVWSFGVLLYELLTGFVSFIFKFQCV
jgi:hypothetical protein